jgi:multidrug efflux pump subunit AcrA (membrane-fusion protein)
MLGKNNMKWKLLVGIAVLVAFAATWFWSDRDTNGWGDSGQELVFYEVSRGDLPIVVTERGYLESQEQTSITCKVESYDRRSGSSGTTILSIVPNGSLVKKGDIIVELDSAQIRDLIESESLELQGFRLKLEKRIAKRKTKRRSPRPNWPLSWRSLIVKCTLMKIAERSSCRLER